MRSARAAGTPFVHAGALYRPAQDCSEGCGAAAVILRVDVLADKEYAETPVARIAPDLAGLYPDGLHTPAAFGDWTLVDGKRWAPAAWRACSHACGRPGAEARPNLLLQRVRIPLGQGWARPSR